MERIAEENVKQVMAYLTQELMRDMVRGLSPAENTEASDLSWRDGT